MVPMYPVGLRVIIRNSRSTACGREGMITSVEAPPASGLAVRYWVRLDARPDKEPRLLAWQQRHIEPVCPVPARPHDGEDLVLFSLALSEHATKDDFTHAWGTPPERGLRLQCAFTEARYCVTHVGGKRMTWVWVLRAAAERQRQALLALPVDWEGEEGTIGQRVEAVCSTQRLKNILSYTHEETWA